MANAYFVIDNAGLISAANDYAKACETYAGLMKSLKTELDNVTAQ